VERAPFARFAASVNWPLVLLTAALVVYGTIVVASATSGMAGSEALVRRHMLGVLLGLVPLGIAWAIDYKRLKYWTGPLMIGVTALLILPMIPGFGVSSGGATSWLQIAGIRLFQPSEPAKLMVIVILAAVIERYDGRIETPRDVLTVLGYLALPLGLILLQPDLGTALVFVAITLGMLVVGGMKARYFVVIALIGIVLVVGVVQLGVLEEYQVNRLVVFIDPEVDPQGAGYNLAQSKIAIGSGGLTGKGLGQGTQSNLNFLPERHTDFVFSVLGEELGFAGAVLLLGLYAGMLLSGLNVSTHSKDLYGALIAAGVVSMWTFQMLVNMGMTIGIMPITGIPLPFMSFGSSFMVTNLAAVGMLLSIYARRYGT
jgi:rod shape determining protein RodA